MQIIKNFLLLLLVTLNIHANIPSQTYSYDAVGNLISKTIDGKQIDYSYNANDQLTAQGSKTFTYDANGNLVSDGKNTYSYDDKNRLVRLTNSTDTVEYSYDANDNRVAKIVNGDTTTYLVDANTPYAQVITESKDSGTTVEYTYGNDLLTDGTHNFLTDALGSTRGLVDSSEALTDSYAYTPYGKLANHIGSSENDFLFTGEQRDPETDNYYLRARYYAPSSARFQSRDTYDGTMNNPITLNHYLYANGNPMTYTDPSGHIGIMGLSASMAISGALIGGGLNIWHQINQPANAQGNKFSIKGFVVWTISGAATGATLAYGGWYALLRFGPQVSIAIGTTTATVGRKLIQKWPSINILKDHFIKHGHEINAILKQAQYTIKNYASDAAFIVDNPHYISVNKARDAVYYIRYLGQSISGKAKFGFVVEKGGKIVSFRPAGIKELKNSMPELFVKCQVSPRCIIPKAIS